MKYYPGGRASLFMSCLQGWRFGGGEEQDYTCSSGQPRSSNLWVYAQATKHYYKIINIIIRYKIIIIRLGPGPAWERSSTHDPEIKIQ